MVSRIQISCVQDPASNYANAVRLWLPDGCFVVKADFRTLQDVFLPLLHSVLVLRQSYIVFNQIRLPNRSSSLYAHGELLAGTHTSFLSEIDKNESSSLLVVFIRVLCRSFPLLWFRETNAAEDSFCQDFLTEIIGFTTLAPHPPRSDYDSDWLSVWQSVCLSVRLSVWLVGYHGHHRTNVDETICNLMRDELFVRLLMEIKSRTFVISYETVN